ncbi:hypothetical protein Trydic_g10846 [Trypoxylus dichotomus]
MIIALVGIVLQHLSYVSCQKVDIKQFCDIKCLNKEDTHTICEFKCKEDPDKCTDFKHYPLSNSERQSMLDMHNMYRNKVASGEDTRGENQQAKDMIALNYDVEIEITTFCWAKRCYFEHDKCRHLPKFKSAGQNLFLQSGTLPIDGKKTALLNVSIKQWYEEIKDTTKELLMKYARSEKMVGHFTQVIWASTEFLGCSRVTWTDKDADQFKFRYHLLCNYSPAGNFYEARVYEFGTGCTPPRQPNAIYPALCGETYKVGGEDEEEDDEDEAPLDSLGENERRNVTGRPFEADASRLSRSDIFLPLMYLILYLNRNYYYTTVC